jgi:Putative zinc-finger
VTLPELHLANVAIAALVDGELSRGARARALDHLARCPECRLQVAVQRQAKAALVEAGVPAVPGGLLSRLADVPMTTDLSAPGGPDGPGSSGSTLAMSGGELMWAAVDPARPSVAVRGAASGPRRPRNSRPRSYPTIGPARRIRLRRGLAGTLAGLAFGVVAAAAPVGSAGTTANVVDRGPGPHVVPAGVGLVPGLGGRRDTTVRTPNTRLTTQLPGTDSEQVGAVVRQVAAAR